MIENIRVLLLFHVFILSWSNISFSKQIKSFGEAKGILKTSIYKGFERTFYCDCRFQKKSIKKGCKVFYKKYKSRSKRLEWEHIVPAHAFGQSFKEWRNAKTLCKRKGKRPLSGRKCASKLNPKFKIMEADIHNLVPVIGSINALRSNLSFSELKSSEMKVCQTDFKIDKRKVSPPNKQKGNVARIYMYMDKQYPGHGIISKKNRKLFNAWNRIDPPDFEECEIYRRKKAVGGNIMSILEGACLKLKGNK